MPLSFLIVSVFKLPRKTVGQAPEPEHEGGRRVTSIAAAREASAKTAANMLPRGRGPPSRVGWLMQQGIAAASFKLTISRDKLATACTYHWIDGLQQFRVHQSAAPARETFEIIHYTSPTSLSCRRRRVQVASAFDARLLSSFACDCS